MGVMIETILFDIDGVLLSEERYFDASALTVWELLYRPAYLGLEGQLFKNDLTNQEIQEIRSTVFQKDDVLNFMKSLGINANWDMVYLTFSYQLILILEAIKEQAPEIVEEGFESGFTQPWLQKVGQVANRLPSPRFQPLFQRFTQDLKSWPEESDLFKRLDRLAEVRLGKKTCLFSSREPLWSVGQAAFQEFYLGSKLYEKVTDVRAADPLKPGFLEDEIPLLPPDQLKTLFESLKHSGYSIGIGTGRPTVETEVPLRQLNLWELFEPNRIVTASDIEKVKKQFPEWGPLSKPHPLTYLIGFFKWEPDLETIYNLPRPIENAETLLIVGDSLADLLAARAIGAQFAAVLTGLSGKSARSTFEKHEADFILNDLSELQTILPK
jgi:phosphoglycolate phosphatase-like HAD superfamily hydrolase